MVCVAVPPHFTSQDCSVCGTRIQKTLSTRTHQCPNYQTVLDRDHNAAINILKKGLKYLGNYLNASTLRRSSGDTSLGIDPSTLLRVNTERSRRVNGTVGQTETDPNALGESSLWILNGDIENLSCLVEQGISDSDRSRIPHHSLA